MGKIMGILLEMLKVGSGLKGGRVLLFALLLGGLQACKQADFYEKEALSELAKPGSDISGGVIITPPTTSEPGDIADGSDSGGSNTGGSNSGGSDSGGSTTPGDNTGGGSSGGGVVVTPPTEPGDNGGSDNGGGNTGGGGGGVVVTPPVDPKPPIEVDPTPIVTLIDKEESFTQNTKKNGDLDILWVIDDSGSMGDEQDALAYNFDAFISEFLKKDVDFQMAITTTDGTTGRNGKQIGNYKLLNSVEAKKNPYVFTNHFKKWVKVGTQGSGREQGLKTSSAFLDRYQSEFIRKDAYFIVVVLSDEEDQSEEKVQKYVDRLQASKNNKGMIKVYSIVTKKIVQGKQWETIGKRYLEATNTTGGKSADIHEEFHSILQDMGGSILNLVDNFALAQSPYQNKIQVLVDGQIVSSGFSFDTQARVLKFDQNNIPREGAKITVRYQVEQKQLLSQN